MRIRHLLVLLLGAAAFGQNSLQRWQNFCQTGNQRVVTQGLNSTTHVQRSYPSCTVTVFLTGTNTLATIYQDNLATPLTNPFTANVDGTIGFSAATSACYDITISGGNPGDTLPAPYTFADQCLGSGGGGGGGGVGPGTVNQVAKFVAPNNVGNSSGGPDDGINPVPWINGLSVNGSGYNKSRPNGAACTSQFLLVEYDGSVDVPTNRATVRTAVASSINVLGVAGQGAGCSGDVQIIDHGFGLCTFDGQTTAHDLVSSSATPGQCSDVGLNPTGVQRLGRVSSINTGAGTNAVVDWFTGDTAAGASGGSGNVLPCATTGCNAYYPTGGTSTIAGDTNVLDLANGILQMLGAHFVDPNHSGWSDNISGPALPPITDSNAVYWSHKPSSTFTSYGVEDFDAQPTNLDCVNVITGDGSGPDTGKWVKLHDAGGPCVTSVTAPVRGLAFTLYNSAGLASGTTTASVTYLTIPFACTIQAYNLAIDTGTITVKFWKIATGTAIPTSGNSINTSGVSISSGTAIHSTTLTDFTTTTVSTNDIMAMDITAVSGPPTFVNGVLQCQ